MHTRLFLLNMGTLHYGLRGSESNDDETFTEKEMNVVAGLGLGFLSGATGVSHIGQGEKGYTAPWTVSPEEAQARFRLYRDLDNEAWESLKSQEEEAAECFDRLLDIDFLQNLEKKEWSTNWGNMSTAEFVYKMGYKHGFEYIERFNKGYFRRYIPLHRDHRWQQDGIEKTMRTIGALNVKCDELYARVKDFNRKEPKWDDSDVENWFNEMQADAWKFLSQRVGPPSMLYRESHSTMAYSSQIPMYYDTWNVELVEKDNEWPVLTFEKQPDMEED
jgi:hypothetical protein